MNQLLQVVFFALPALFIVFLIERFERAWSRPKPRTSIKCERCDNELCSSDSFISDNYDEDGNNHVIYRCARCGLECDYTFDAAPVPIKWSELVKRS